MVVIEWSRNIIIADLVIRTLEEMDQESPEREEGLASMVIPNFR
jgi:hypothetical protein